VTPGPIPALSTRGLGRMDTLDVSTLREMLAKNF
jgi:hypothetical protein